MVPMTDPTAPVSGACLVEGPEMVDQIEPGWFVVTEGTNLAHQSDSVLRDVLRSIRERGASAVVVKLGRGWDVLPQAMVDEAQYADLPLFTMAGETSVGYFLRYVHEAAGIEDLAVLSRALSIQTDLLDALAYPDVEQELIRRVAESLGISAVLYSQDLQVISSQGAAPIHLIADAIRMQAASRTTVGRWEVHFGSIEATDKTYWLAFAWQVREEPSAEVLRSSRRAIEQLLRAHTRTLAASRAQEYIQRARLVNEILAGVDESRLERLRDQLVLLHFPREGIFQVHAIEPADHSTLWRDSLDTLASSILELAATHDIQVLLGVHEGHFVVLHTGREEFSRRLVDMASGDNHGSSSTFTDLTQAAAALRQATISLSAGTRYGTFTPFYRVGFAEFVLGHVPPDELRVKSDQVLSGLAEYPAAVETLVHYLRNSLDIQATGQSMHLHPNSIRYRLAKIEEILDTSLSDPETVTVLYLSLHELIRSDQDRFPDLTEREHLAPLRRDVS